MADLHGTCDERFGAVREALAETLDDQDVGACAAVVHDGELVADLWGGYADEDRTTPWQRDTIVNVWSTTKTMTALCALILADQGELDVTAPVARYWPEFAAAGKDGVLVSHLLSHTAGLPEFTAPMTVADLYDWPLITSRLAAQAPVWAPGTAAGYHALTQGYLVGEVIRRVTGATPGEFFAAEVAGPLGADFHIGLAAEHDHRVAPVIPPPDPEPGKDESDRAEPDKAEPAEDGFQLRASEANTAAWRRAEIPAANGHGNARSVALVQSVLAAGGTAGAVRLLSPDGCAPAWQEQYRGPDRVLGHDIRYGLGYGLMGGSCYWGGWGGSMVVIDRDAQLTVAYAMNRMLDDDDNIRALGIATAAYSALDR
jgi:CubicO group peptidase (beta-lactamase class C family)